MSSLTQDLGSFVADLSLRRIPSQGGDIVLGPWIHVGSRVCYHTAARVNEQLTLRSRVTSNVVNKGHAIVEFDAIVIADGARTITEIAHAAIWRPRQVAEAS
jgi:hypothetical protein